MIFFRWPITINQCSSINDGCNSCVFFARSCPIMPGKTKWHCHHCSTAAYSDAHFFVHFQLYLCVYLIHHFHLYFYYYNIEVGNPYIYLGRKCSTYYHEMYPLTTVLTTSSTSTVLRECRLCTSTIRTTALVFGSCKFVSWEFDVASFHPINK